MRDKQGRGVIRLGDSSSHGGVVKTALPGFAAQGKPPAGQGCLVWCPRCRGNFRLLVTDAQRRHHGIPLAYHGDATECGARVWASL